MRKIQLFNHKDLMRLGFIIPDPDQEDLLLESVNNEYIRRINRLLAESLSTKEISSLVNQSESDISEYFLVFKPGCIDKINTLRETLELEMKEKRKNILTKGSGTLDFRDKEDDVT